MKITVLGTGAWGTALACVLASNKHEVVMWGIDQKQIDDLNTGCNTKYFGDGKLFASVKATSDLKSALLKTDYVLIAVPSQFIRETLMNVKNVMDVSKKKPIFINVAKGLDQETDDVWSKTIIKILKENASGVVSLIGPSFAVDVFKQKPTIVNSTAKKFEQAKGVAKLFNSGFFKVVPIADEIGAQILSALKNLLAIAIGIAEENHNSINTISSLLTAGINEMQAISKALGSKDKTILNVCGIGDIFLTCTCDKSRNFTLGKEIYKYGLYKALEKNTVTVEGYKVFPIVSGILKSKKIKAPIFSFITQVLSGDLDPKDFVDKAINQIMINESLKTIKN